MSTAQADWESEFQDQNTYWGLSGNLVLPDIESQLGRAGRRPFEDVVDDFPTTGGLSLHFGYRVHPYFAIEVAAEWVDDVTFTYDSVNRLTESFDVLTGSVRFKGYPLAKILDTVMEGRIQPYAYFSPGIVGAHGASSQTPIHMGVGVGGGVEVWVAEAYTVHFDARHTWAFGNLNGLNWTTLGFGGAYHF